MSSIFKRDFFRNLITIILVNNFIFINIDELLNKLKDQLEWRESILKIFTRSDFTEEDFKELKDIIAKNTFTLQLAEHKELPILNNKFIEIIKMGNILMSQLSKEMIEYLLLRNRLITVVSDFEQYLHNSLTYILNKYPEILSEKDLKLGRVLKHGKKNNFRKIVIKEMIEKELYNLFYEDYTEIFDYTKKKLSLNHNISKELIIQLKEVKLIRNLFVHNNGIVNTKFLDETLKFNDLKVGDEVELSTDFLDELFQPVEIAVIEFDKSLIKTFPELTSRNIKGD